MKPTKNCEYQATVEVGLVVGLVGLVGLVGPVRLIRLVSLVSLVSLVGWLCRSCNGCASYVQVGLNIPSNQQNCCSEKQTDTYELSVSVFVASTNQLL